jgi:hypothetical protein
VIVEVPERLLAFYAGLGVPEIWVIERDTKTPEVYVLQDSEYRQEPPADDGWVQSPLTGVLMRGGLDGKLDIQREGDPATRRALRDARSAF